MSENNSNKEFNVIPLSNADKLFTARLSHFVPLVIINKINWSLPLELYFDMQARAISSVLYGTNKLLRVINLLFDLNFFQASLCNEKIISFHLYWSIKGLMFWSFNAMVKASWKNLSSLFLDLLLLFYFLAT